MDGILKKTNFFLEAYTPHGLCSFFDGLYNADRARSVYLVTGGISSVSSMLIKLVSDNITSQGFCAHQISNALCSHQLDAVCFPELDVCLSNGGERGTLSVRYPIASENVVGLSSCFDCDVINENSQDIKQLFKEERYVRLRASGFLSAAQSLINDSKIIQRKCIDADKISRYASRLARREFDNKQGVKGKEYKRFLSSITPRGVETYTKTLLNLCDRFYIFNDRYGAVTDYLLGVLKECALSCGYDIISCYCPMSGGFSVEHLVVPELSLCFYSDKPYHSAEFIEHRKISSNRFTNVGLLAEHKKRLCFDRKGANEMLGEAVKLLGSAENIRKRIDFIYLSCIDNSALCSLADRITNEILSKK